MRSLEWVLSQYDWYPYKKRKFGPRDVCRENSCEVEGRDQDDVSISQGMPKIAKISLETAKHMEQISPLQPPEGTNASITC